MSGRNTKLIAHYSLKVDGHRQATRRRRYLFSRLNRNQRTEMRANMVKLVNTCAKVR